MGNAPMVAVGNLDGGDRVVSKRAFTYLDPGAWQQAMHHLCVRVHDALWMEEELYRVILTIRVAARCWTDWNRVEDLARRFPTLINVDFFNPDVYAAATHRQRLAACLAWAIASYRGDDPTNLKPELKAAAFCLAQPMAGGELVPMA